MSLLRAVEAMFFSGGEDSPSQKPGAQQTGVVPGSRFTVLAIDDDPSFLNTVRAVLSAAGYNVLTSTSGPKGLDMLRYAPSEVRVILLDYNMPNFDGAQTLDYLRRLSPASKVIGLTGADVNLVPYRFCKEVDHMIQKPFRGDDLVGSIEKLGATTAGAPMSPPSRATEPTATPTPVPTDII